jgi:hypothetical protein
MKNKNIIIMIMIALIIIIPSSFAEDIKITINDEDIPSEIIIKPEDIIKIKINISKEILIEDISIKSSIKSFNAIINHFLKKDLKFDRTKENIVEETTINVPKIIPKGEPTFIIKINYNINEEKKTYEKEIKIIIENGSTLLGITTKILPQKLVSFILKFF